MSADEADIDEAAPPRVTDKLFGHGGTEGCTPCRLSQRPRAARFHADRPEGHRQGDARLSHGALCARASGSVCGVGSRSDIARGRPGTSGGAPRGGAGAWRSSRSGAHAERERRACGSKSRSTTCAARFLSSARPQARAAGGSRSSMRSTNSTGLGRTRCSRCLRSRRSGRCCCWCVIRRRGCCRRCARAAACWRCGRWRNPMLPARLAASVGSAENDPQIEAAAAAADGSVARAFGVFGRGRVGAAPARARGARATAGAQCQRSACAWRCACRHRPTTAWCVCRHRQRLAVAKPRSIMAP